MNLPGEKFNVVGYAIAEYKSQIKIQHKCRKKKGSAEPADP